MNKNERIKYLVSTLNNARDKYYNGQSFLTDVEYDALFDELDRLEQDTGIVYPNSPTQNVGYAISSGLKEVTHEYPPMLSLDKSKDINKIGKFLNERLALVMGKMDGITCRLTYEDGKLVRAETRGDGITGEDITHNAKIIPNIPQVIKQRGRYIIDGELIIKLSDFARLQDKIVDENGKKYANARNLAAGSARLLDSSESAKRCLNFIAWKFVNSSAEFFSESLEILRDFGFDIVPYEVIKEETPISALSESASAIAAKCKQLDYKIDGCVFSFDEMRYLETFGYTSHHWKGQLAYKFEDDQFATKVRDIYWTLGKTGAITPTAIFDTVEIDGTHVNRASLHNLTIMQSLNIRKNSTAFVYKANMIIPQIASTLDDGDADFSIPATCPICGKPTSIRSSDGTETLVCTNSECTGQLLAKFKTFVSKSAFDIDGLGDKNLELFIEHDLIEDFADIFSLKDRRDYLLALDGFGVSSVDGLLAAIEAAKTITLDKFITSLSIPNIGSTTAKTISKYFNGNAEAFMSAISLSFDWSVIDGIGAKTATILQEWLIVHYELISDLLDIVTIDSHETKATNSSISGKTFCITGTFNESRSTLQNKLEALGGIAVASVSKKTDILFVGENAGSKLKKAQDLNIIIYDEENLNKILRGD